MYVATQKCAGVSGLGDCGCGGKCGGLGLFESGLNWNDWGWMEWVAIIAGGYVLVSVISTTSRAGRAAGKTYRSARRFAQQRSKRADRKRELKQELSSL